jgi:hypothetical protein
VQQFGAGIVATSQKSAPVVKNPTTGFGLLARTKIFDILTTRQKTNLPFAGTESSHAPPLAGNTLFDSNNAPNPFEISILHFSAAKVMKAESNRKSIWVCPKRILSLNECNEGKDKENKRKNSGWAENELSIWRLHCCNTAATLT